ncbi:hypothetical protein [Agaribacterium sp. ZY112]|uniref:hypothetical protein n=1 Tax=Agaribacterium sp. ZY112 TaxID=3233574 RepID=UPI003525FB84
MKKVAFKFNRRHTMYTTLIACAVGLWMMLTRFGLSKEIFLSYLLLTFVFVGGLIAIAALIGFILRKLQERSE